MNEQIRGNKIGWGMEHSLPLRHRSFSFWGKALAKLAADLPWALDPVGRRRLCWMGRIGWLGLYSSLSAG